MRDSRVLRLARFYLIAPVVLGLIILQTTHTLDPVANAKAFALWLYSLGSYQIDRIWNEVLHRDWIGLLINPFNAAITGIYLLSLLVEVAIHSHRTGSAKQGWQASSLYRLSRFTHNRTARTDLFMFVYNRLALDAFVMQALMLLGPLFVFAAVQANLNLNLFSHIPNPVLQFGIYILVQDFIYYWFHRISHESAALWEIHKFHHAATEMNIVTGVRDHPFEKAMQTSLSAIPLALLGAPIEQFVAFWLLVTVVNVWFHSDFDWHFGKLDYIFISPRTHRIHHSLREEHWDQNYGVILSIWDHLFGTFYKGPNHQPEFGVTDNYFNQKTLMFDLVEPMRRFYRVLLRGK